MKVEQIMKGFIYSISEGRFKQAERLIRKNIRNKGNELSKELLSLGFYYGIVENYDSAIFCLELAQGITKDTRIRGEAEKYLAVAHNILGIRLTKMGLLDQAETHYKKAISLKPDFSQFYNNHFFMCWDFSMGISPASFLTLYSYDKNDSVLEIYDARQRFNVTQLIFIRWLSDFHCVYKNILIQIFYFIK